MHEDAASAACYPKPPSDLQTHPCNWTSADHRDGPSLRGRPRMRSTYTATTTDESHPIHPRRALALGTDNEIPALDFDPASTQTAPMAMATPRRPRRLAYHFFFYGDAAPMRSFFSQGDAVRALFLRRASPPS
ncbi:hypothetical protein B0H13DRAFT_2364871 [Mycena leptocephala]|nr:hypothetical protein B0H13DRAFT_2364871 [Mycena leptocephala]